MKYRILLPVGLSAGYFFFNLRYLTRIVGWDTLTYTHNVGSGSWSSVLYNPHHLAFEFAGFLWWQFLSLFWKNAPLYFSLQLWMLTCSALFPVIFAWIFARVYNDLTGAVTLSLAMIFSEAYFFYAQTFDTAVHHAVLQCLLFLLCADGVRRGFTRVSVGIIFIVQFLTIFFHQADVLFVLMFPAAWWMRMVKERPGTFRDDSPPLNARPATDQRNRIGNPLWTPFIYLITLGVAVVGLYLWTGLVVLKRNLASADDFHFTRWLLMYAIAGKWGLPVSWAKRIEWSWHGIGDSFLSYEGRTDRFRTDFSHLTDPAVFPFNVVPLFFLFVVLVGLFTLRRQIRRFAPEYLLLCLWLGPTIVFFSWWEGYYFEYWLGLILGLWLFSYFVLTAAIPEFMRSTGKAALTLAYTALALTLGFTNFRLSVGPRSRQEFFPEKHFGERTIERIKRESIFR